MQVQDEAKKASVPYLQREDSISFYFREHKSTTIYYNEALISYVSEYRLNLK